MRCKYCGSKMIFPGVNHEHSSAGKVIAGTVAFGIVGAAATLAGKNVKGYRCSACGMFSETPMDAAEEVACNSAVIEAQVRGQSAAYERCKGKYPNIENVSLKVATDNVARQVVSIETTVESGETAEISPSINNVKRCYQQNKFVVDCPIFVDQVTIKKSGTSDMLVMDVCNISKNTLRSAYFNVVICDDIGDQIGTLSCVYQGLAVAPGGFLPRGQEFDLKTDIAYSVFVECEKVAFTDDSVWRRAESPVVHNLAQRQEITELNFPLYKYLRILLSEKTRITEDRKLYCPVYEEKYRICVCGNPVSVGKSCEVCGLDESGLLDITNYDTLMQCRRDLIVSTAKARAKKTEQLYKEAQEDKYNEANALLQKGTKASCEQAASCFWLIIDYKDSKEKIKECQTRAEGAQKDTVYYSALAELNTRVVRQDQYEKAIAILEQIRGWRDANEKIEEYKKHIEELKEKEEQERIRREQEQEQRELWGKKRKKKNIIISIVVIAAIAAVIVAGKFLYENVWIPSRYARAEALYNAEDYAGAKDMYLELGTYKDSADRAVAAEQMLLERRYEYVLNHKNRDNQQTYKNLKELIAAGYKDSAKIYNDLFGCKIRILANKNEKDEQTDDLTEVKHGETFYFHISVSGGYPGEKVRFKIVSNENAEASKTLYSDYVEVPSDEQWGKVLVTNTAGYLTDWIELEVSVDDVKETKKVIVD